MRPAEQAELLRHLAAPHPQHDLLPEARTRSECWLDSSPVEPDKRPNFQKVAPKEEHTDYREAVLRIDVLRSIEWQPAKDCRSPGSLSSRFL